MNTILISGGAGYIGTELTKYLLQKYNVIVYDKFYFPWLKKNKNKLNTKNKLKFIKKNINAVETNDFNKVDIVCDLNGISNDPSSELNAKYTWEVNYKSRLKFAKLAKKAGVKRYIYNSTCSVYGFNKKKVFENSGKNPLSTYAKANLAAEKEIYKLRNTSFKVNILRNATLFGFSNTMRLDLVINIFVLNLINKKNIFIDGNGKQFRPFISVHDILKVYEKIIYNNSFSSFICNLVSFNSTVKSIAYKICKILKINNKNILFNDKFFDRRNYIVGSKNFKKIFGSNFKFSSFEKEILNLKKNILKYKISVNTETIRMKFYKKLFH